MEDIQALKAFVLAKLRDVTGIPLHQSSPAYRGVLGESLDTMSTEATGSTGPRTAMRA